ncbi:hypothetical protein ABW20_dc0104380 [Dactylellina cionopaga]|nr:hypothetical protein ABW20_dc0104380 [Dactylellina cionopaga]
MASGTGRGLTSLYADLLEPKLVGNDQKSSTISKSPLIFAPSEPQLSSQDAPSSNDQSASTKKQPIPRRPQPTQQKVVKKVGINPLPKQSKSDTSNDQQDPASISSAAVLAARAPVIKSTLEDWATNEDEDVNGFYTGTSRQRGGRKRRRKNKDRELEKTAQSWDDIYDPSRPNLYEEYRESEEKDRETRDWRDRLYGRRRAFSSDYSEDETARFSGNGESHPFDPLPIPDNHFLNTQPGFAPPPNLGFAPPSALAEPVKRTQIEPAPVFDAATGDEVWMMRAKLTQRGTDSASFIRDGDPIPLLSEPEPSRQNRSPRPLADVEDNPLTNVVHNPPGFTHSQNSIISCAPIIYSLSPAPPDIVPESQGAEGEGGENEDISSTGGTAGRSSRPGQKGFAERLMSKYGWTKGTGLGANSSGMVHALQVKADKGKDSKGVGKILDKNKKRDNEESKFGKMSEVVVLHKMVDGLEDEDLVVLMQEIGDECSEKYGRIERVHIVHKRIDDVSSKVFVQFTSQLSALRSLSEEEQKLFRLYGKLPSKKDILSNKLKERKYFDSGDYALSKAGKASDVGVTQIGSKHPLPENIPHSHTSTGSTTGTPSGSMSSGSSGAPVKEGLLMKKSTSPEPDSDVAVQETNEGSESPVIESNPPEDSNIPKRWRSQS